MLYILDTDHITLWQHRNSVVISNLRRVPETDYAVTAISLTEQVQGWQAAIARTKDEAQAAHAINYLCSTMTFYGRLQIIQYDSAAVAEFERLRKAKARIGTQDLRIAAIALSRSATVVTRNLRDFRQVPGLSVIDWSVPSA